MRSTGKRTNLRTGVKWALATIAVVSLSACGTPNSTTQIVSSPQSSFTAVAQNSNAPITVWVDSTRLPGVQAYQKSHPDVKLNIVT